MWWRSWAASTRCSGRWTDERADLAAGPDGAGGTARTRPDPYSRARGAGERAGLSALVSARAGHEIHRGASGAERFSGRPGGLRLYRRAVSVPHLAGAQVRGLAAGAARPDARRLERHIPDGGGRGQAAAEGGHHSHARRPAAICDRAVPGVRADGAGLHGAAVQPVLGGLRLRSLGAVRAFHLDGGGDGHPGGGLGVQQQVFAAGRRAGGGATALLRNPDGAGSAGGGDAGGHALADADRAAAGGPVEHRRAAPFDGARLSDLFRLLPGRGQPRALRSAGGRIGAGRRLSYRVFGDALRVLLPGGVRQQLLLGGPGGGPLLRRLAGSGTAGAGLVHAQGAAAHRPDDVGAMDAATPAHRPDDGVLLEAAGASGAGLALRDRPVAGEGIRSRES